MRSDKFGFQPPGNAGFDYIILLGSIYLEKQLPEVFYKKRCS